MTTCADITEHVDATGVGIRAGGDGECWHSIGDPDECPCPRYERALCTCTGHGPDPACVEHGEALRAWQAREASR